MAGVTQRATHLKSELPPARLRQMLSVARYRNELQRRIASVEHVARRYACGVFAFDDYRSTFGMDGSVVLSRGRFAYHEFFSLAGRASKKAAKWHLRGPRYLVSLDPTLEVRQKLITLEHDLADAVANFNRRTGASDKRAFVERIGLLDYAKNAAVTMFNALVQPEKQGRFHATDSMYTSLRRNALEVAMLATTLYYAHLLGNDSDVKASLRRLKTLLNHVADVATHIEKQYVEGTFSSRHFQRPEAAHPLVLAGAAYCVASSATPVDVVVGLPSGGTEFAILQQYLLAVVRGSFPSLLLLPYSLHSVKNQFDGPSAGQGAFIEHLRLHSASLDGRNVLIAEDNSSTGRTIQDMMTLIRVVAPYSSVRVVVAEADLVRSVIDRDSPDRPNIADSAIYKYSMNVLPISRKIAPKADIRNIIEQRRLMAHYGTNAARASSTEDKIMYRVFLRMIEAPTEAELKNLSEDNAVLRFENTVLSNFYITPKPIRIKRTLYPSVEHAYQAQKFAPGVLGRVAASHKEELREILRVRGQQWTSSDVTAIFTDRAVSAGTVKVSANHLRSRGYVRRGWDDMKIRLMIGLLMQKFAQQQPRSYLQSTGKRYLVEGNTWQDTLWGVYQGRGRNLLGLILMDLRDSP